MSEAEQEPKDLKVPGRQSRRAYGLFGGAFLACWLITFLLSKNPWEVFGFLTDDAPEASRGSFQWFLNLLDFAGKTYHSHHFVVATLIVIGSLVGTVSAIFLAILLIGSAISLFHSISSRDK